MCSSLSLLRKLPHKTNVLTECCTGKQFSRKELKNKLKFLLAWLPLSASARASVLHASSSGEETVENRTMRTRKRGLQGGMTAFWQRRTSLRSIPKWHEYDYLQYSTMLKLPQAKVFSCPEGHFCRREWKRWKRKLQFQIKTIWSKFSPNATFSENQLICKWVLSL